MIHLAGHDFKNQTELADFVRSIRDRYPDGESIGPTDSEFLIELIKRHPEFPDKFQPGIRRLYVEEERRGSRGFRFETTDGRSDDFSFLKCISNRPSSDDANAKVAARCAIEQQVLDFKATQFAGPVTCGLCSEVLTRTTSHVDHVPPQTFVVIWSHFVRQQGGIPESAERSGFAGERVFLSEEVCRQWQEFHATFAVLRMLCKRCNLSTAKKQV